MQYPAVVILCGGKGTRLREYSEVIPKGLVEIGGMPILWHIMKIYAHFGCSRFVLCLGYKGDMIKEYFWWHKCRSEILHAGGSDEAITYRDGSDEWTIPSPRPDWREYKGSAQESLRSRSGSYPVWRVWRWGRLHQDGRIAENPQTPVQVGDHDVR